MGTFSYKVEIGSTDLSRFDTLEFLVDTGSTYTWIPKDLVSKLGFKVTGQRRVRLADGREVLRDGVDANIRIDGEIHPNFCLIAGSGDSLLLGAITLETFSLGVDPVNKKLIPVVASAM